MPFNYVQSNRFDKQTYWQMKKCILILFTSSIASEIYRAHSLTLTLIAGNSQPVGNSMLDTGNAAAGNDSTDATAARRSSGAAASANSRAGLCRSRRRPLGTATDAFAKLRRAAGSGSRSGLHDARCPLVRLGGCHCASAAVAIADAA